MFRGIHAVNMDAKGRMAIPTKFRDLLLSVCSGDVVVTVDPNTKNLTLYPLSTWEEVQKKIEALPSLHPQTRRLRQLVIGYASDLQIDNSGRILLPPMLRKYARLEKQLVLLGQGNKIEIWSEPLWEERLDDMQDASANSEPMPQEMADLSI